MGALTGTADQTTQETIRKVLCMRPDCSTVYVSPMALYPRQNSNFCLQHCCFELLLVFTFQYSTSQFNILHSKFNVHDLNATLFIEHATFLFNVQCMRCKMRYASNAIQHPCSLHSQSISIFCFHISSFNMQHSCLSMQR